MNRPHLNPRMTAAWLLLVLLFLPGGTGCKPMLYPVARAFGGPSETELKRCRAAFDRLKAQKDTAHIVVYSALDPRGPQEAWDPGTADRLAALMQEKGMAHAVPAPAPKGVEPTPLGGNQLRYAWNRARLYGGWIRRSHPDGDFSLFVEMFHQPTGDIVGLQLYVLDRSGEVAYRTLMNSHHFQRPSVPGPQEAITLLHGIFQWGLSRQAEEIFPPYGVG